MCEKKKKKSRPQPSGTRRVAHGSIGRLHPGRPGGSRLTYGLLPRSFAGLSPALLFQIQALLASSFGR